MSLWIWEHYIWPKPGTTQFHRINENFCSVPDNHLVFSFSLSSGFVNSRRVVV